MSNIELRAFPLIPRSRIGKLFLGIIALAVVSTALSVYGVLFNEPELIGPLPQAVFWHYFWYGIMHLVLIGTYLFLFKPWAESVEAETVTRSDPAVDETEVVIND